MSLSEAECSSRRCYQLSNERTVEVLLPKDFKTLTYSFEMVFDGEATVQSILAYNLPNRTHVSGWIQCLHNCLWANLQWKDIHDARTRPTRTEQLGHGSSSGKL